jgi:hypothetical protein
MVCEWFGPKTTRTVFASLASKSVVTVSGGLVSKLAATVFLHEQVRWQSPSSMPDFIFLRQPAPVGS